MSSMRCWRCSSLARGQFIINYMSKSKNNKFNFLDAVANVGVHRRIFCSSSNDGQNSGLPPKQERMQTAKVEMLSEAAVFPRQHGFACYNIASARNIKVPAGGRASVATDLAIFMERGMFGLITQMRDVAVPLDAAAFVIDPSVRGPIDLVLFNHFGVDLEVKVGDVIATLRIYAAAKGVEVVEDDSLKSIIR